MRGTALTLLLLCVAAACSDSHVSGTGDASVDAMALGCLGPAPAGCATMGSEPGCCDRVDPSCVEGEWHCPDPSEMGWACESYDCGGAVECFGPEPACRQDLGDGCCGESRPALCAPPFGYSCGAGSLREDECDRFTPECGDACAGLSERECVEDFTCTPLYDNTCCPACTPGPCADCVRFEMTGCVAAREACSSGGLCGEVAPWVCGSERDCSSALPTTDDRCSVPGCVTAIPSGCLDCERECVRLSADSCSFTCRRLPPPCTDGRVAEADGFCFTGRCIPASVCAL